MELEVLKTYKPLFLNNTRYYLLYGGRAGGRSYAASQKAIVDTKVNEFSRIAAMRYILGDVRSSIWQEIKDRIEEHELPEVTQDQAMRYELNGNSIDGKGFKKSTSQNIAKLKSLASYTTIIIEEADEIDEIDFDNLDSSIRTVKGDNKIILCFNMPNKDHWIIKRWFNLLPTEFDEYFIADPKNLPDTTYIFSTYHDNRKNLTDSVVNTYESLKDKNPEYYYTMIKGYVSEGKRGRVFKTWKPISNAEYEALPYTEYYGLDFGFTNDPTALVAMKYHNDTVYHKQLLYKTHLTNQDICRELRRLEIKGRIIADSAEPKSIEEIKREGFDIVESVKGADSIRSGIGIMNSKEIYYTEDSEDLINETLNYIYALDKNKNPTNDPIDEFNHIMDACRYVDSYYLGKSKKVNLRWL